jgi:hypothetical protein
VSAVDPQIEHAMEMGRKNAETIGLIRRHCANARIELGHGHSMLEGMTGLPISPRTVRCDYARVNAGESNNLEWVATDFYRENCVGCPHRQIVGVPNLATLVGQLNAEAEQARKREEAAEAERTHEREERRHQRHTAAAGEPPPTRDLLRSIDDVDAAEPDGGAAARLLAGVRGTPEIVTPRAAEILIDAAAQTGNGRLLESLRYLLDHSRISPDRLVETAAVVLERRALEPEAVRLLLRLRAGVTPDVIRRLRKVIVNLAGPPTREEEIFSGFANASGREEGLWDELLLLAYEVDAATILATVSELLQADDDYTRLRAAGTASVVFRVEPGTVPVLAAELTEALRKPDAIAPLHWDEASADKIGLALGVAVEVAPAAARDAIELAARSVDEPRREILFRAYDHAARDHLRDEIDAEVAHAVIEVALKRLTGDWGAEIAFSASDTIELVTHYHGHHLEHYVGALVGALLDAVRTPEPTYHPLLDFQAELNPLGGLEAVSGSMRRRAIIGRLRDAVGYLAPRFPEQILERIGGFLEVPEGAEEDDEVKEMRRLAIRILGSLGQRHELLPLVVPHLYTALAGTDVGAKCEAIAAWREIGRAHPMTQLPRELGAMLPAILSDPYVYVHKTAIREVSHGLSVPDDVAHQVLIAAANLATYYAAEDDTDVLDDALRVVIFLSRRFDHRNQQALLLFALKQALHLRTYDLQRFLESHRRDLRDFSEYPRAILQVLGSPEIVRDLNARDNLLLRELRNLRPDLIVGCVNEIRATAFAWVPERIGPALEFVEVLQRGGCWDAAVELATEIHAAIPDTPADAGRRALARWVVDAARLEAAVTEGGGVDAELVADWRQADADYEQAAQVRRDRFRS